MSMSSYLDISQMHQAANTLFSAYASFAGSMMLVKTMADQIIPHQLRSYLFSTFHYFFTPSSNQLTLVFNEFIGKSQNHVFDAAQVYLSTKISPKTERIIVAKTQRQKNFTLALDKGEEIPDMYENIKLKWKFICVEDDKSGGYHKEKRSFELSFHMKDKEKVVNSYLPFVLVRGDEIKAQEKVVRLYSRDIHGGCDDDERSGTWGSVNLEHPSTFDTLAMDPELKKMIVDDLDRFLRRKELYKKVGKAWKRGYLLYGPPGTGKSSLIAAMANYLKFDIYDLELTSIYSNSELKSLLLSTKNRSILIIEDIDCSAETKDRENNHYGGSDTKLTLSGILNFIDGLWSSCGDERIIVFTTNHKDRLDPALLRPGRMDVHINLSYCTFDGFKLLVSNYLGGVKSHPLFGEIEGLMETTEVTPAEVAEELLKSDDVDVTLQGLVTFLQCKKDAVVSKNDDQDSSAEIRQSNTDHDDDKKSLKKRKNNDDNEMKSVQKIRGRGRGRGGRNRRP